MLKNVYSKVYNKCKETLKNKTQKLKVISCLSQELPWNTTKSILLSLFHFMSLYLAAIFLKRQHSNTVFMFHSHPPSTRKIQMFKRNWQCVSHRHVILRSISHL